MASGNTKSILSDLKKSFELQQRLNKGLKEYRDVLKEIKGLNKNIEFLKSSLVKQSIKEREATDELRTILRSRATYTRAEIKAAIERVKQERKNLVVIRDEIRAQKELLGIYEEQVKQVSKLGLAFQGTAKDLKGMSKGVTFIYNKLGSLDLFKFQKAIKSSALQMGILSSQSGFFSKRIQDVAMNTVEFGFDIENVAQMQTAYSDSLGRTVVMGQDAAESMAAMAKSTGLGSDGAGELAANMDMIGYSAKQTAGYVEQVMNDATSMGLNSTKVIKNIASNIKILNKYNFKNGAKGLAKMAEATTKMGVSLDMVSGMADKLFDIDGAVEMSAQLQVLGGEWSKLADPFKLMYMARNDMEGLTTSIINATKASAKFNAATGEFDISGLEMQRLRKIAEATGLDFQQLAQSAKEAAKFSKIDTQINFKADDATKQFIENTAMFDQKSGGYTIEINGNPKLLSALNDSDKEILQNQAKERENMKERAKSARSFDEVINNTITMFKQLLLPFLDTLTKDLGPRIDSFVKSFKENKWGEKIQQFASSVASFVGGIAEFIFKHPIWTVALFGVFEAAKWFANGLALRAGFNSAGGMGGAGGGGFLGMGGKMGKGMGGLLGGGMIGGINALGSSSTGEAIGNVAGGGIGGVLGSLFLSEFLGPLGTMLGAQAGSWLGGKLGSLFSDNQSSNTQPVGMNDGILKFDTNKKQINDGVVKFNPNDKFTKVDDGTMIAGTNVNGNKELAKILSSSAPQIQNKNSLIGNSQSGNVNYVNNKPSDIKVNLSDLNLNGVIELKIDNLTNKELGVELLKDPSFIRNISKMVNIATESAISGTKKA